MKKYVVKLNLNKNSYNIIIGNNLLSSVNKYFDLNRKTLIITDDNIPKTYINKIRKSAKNSYVLTIRHGEKNKNYPNYQKIISTLTKYNFDRKSAILALGGGMIGDISGFAASTYMRGIDFFNVPTTLLSQVDSSIGGKTAINILGIKNLIGSFYHPKKVLIDIDTLKTLSEREFYSGLVETIKMSATFDKKLFNYIKDCNDIHKNIEYIIYRSLLIKKTFIEKDEKERNLRQVLNFGHTIGHAIEEIKNYRFLHGECVGLGMLYFTSSKVKKELEEVLIKYNLPTKCNFDKKKALSLISHDKKSTDGKISTIYVDKIGSFKIKTLDLSEIKKILL